MVDTKNQEMKIIISLSEILHYIQYCHPYVLCRRGCAERVVASFAHQIQSEYWVAPNIVVSPGTY